MNPLFEDVSWDRCVNAGNHASFADALAASEALAARGTGEAFLLVSNAQIISEDTLIPLSVTLIIFESGLISGPHRLTIRGAFRAEPHRVFGSTIDVILEKGSVPWAYPQWWGGASLAAAVLGDGVFQMTLIISHSGNISVKTTIPPAFPETA